MAAEPRPWRRRHAQDIIAEVTLVTAVDSWDVSVWQKPVRKTHADRYFWFLTDAHVAADSLAAVTFEHQCNAACGPWQAVERRQKPR
jgi:hypothetical protein